MILVHRLRGEPLFLNEDLIESIETRPHTLVTLVDGCRYVLSDDAEDIIEAARSYRASVLLAVEDMRDGNLSAEIILIREGDEADGV